MKNQDLNDYKSGGKKPNRLSKHRSEIKTVLQSPTIEAKRKWNNALKLMKKT